MASVVDYTIAWLHLVANGLKTQRKPLKKYGTEWRLFLMDEVE
jgi:hypothetical protein